MTPDSPGHSDTSSLHHHNLPSSALVTDTSLGRPFIGCFRAQRGGGEGRGQGEQPAPGRRSGQGVERSIRFISKTPLSHLDLVITAQTGSDGWISQYEVGTLRRGEEERKGKRKPAVIHVNTCRPPSPVLEY